MLRTILLIDDEEQIRRVYQALLNKEGFQVSTANGYESAMELISSHEFALVISDIRMAGQSGIDFLKEIRRQGILSEVLLITGFPDLETARDAIRYGALDYLTKPVFKDELFRLAHFAIGHYHLKREKESLELNIQAAMRALQDGVIMVDTDQRILYANQAAQALCQLPNPCHGLDLSAAMQNGNTPFYDPMLSLLATAQTNCPGPMIYDNTGRHGVSCSPLLGHNQTLLGQLILVRGTSAPTTEDSTPASSKQHGILGKSQAIQHALRLVEALAGLDTTVLITGESGVGKELAAEALHAMGNRRQRPFIAVNCAAVADSLLESELFGHVRGAFTHAVRDHVGKLQQADKGTIFLDEVGDTSPAMQARLLRFLEKGEIQRVGDEKTLTVDTRVIAATNQNLPAMVAAGTFRKDLYYRLKVVEIILPPLRERLEDIPILADHFLARFAAKYHKHAFRLAPETLEILQKHDWPGNVRELAHLLEHAAILTSSEVIGPEMLPPALTALRPPVAPVAAPTLETEGLKLTQALLIQTLEQHRWNITEVAKALGVSRTTIYRKMEEFNIPK